MIFMRFWNKVSPFTQGQNFNEYVFETLSYNHDKKIAYHRYINGILDRLMDYIVF